MIDEYKKKQFKHRFRVDISFFRGFLHFADSLNWFPNWGEYDQDGQPRMSAIGTPSHSLGLLMLAAFRYLGRNVTFDCLSEVTGIPESTLNSFFKDFIEVLSREYYPFWVKIPIDEEEINQLCEGYAANGFPGCIGSIDVTHCIWELCPASKKVINTNGRWVNILLFK